MTALTGQPGPEGARVDLVAVARDAELLDRLAVRSAVPEDDTVALLLAAFAAEIDEGLDDVLGPDADDPRVVALVDAAGAAAPVVPLRGPRRRGRGLRATTVAVVVGTTLSISGVAAAVTGDPLAPVKGLATAIGITDPPQDLPGTAASGARINHAVTGLRAQVARGELDGVQGRIDALRARLDGTPLDHGRHKGLAKRLAALQAALDRATKAADRSHGQGQGQGRGQDQGHGQEQGQDQSQGQGQGGPGGPGQDPTAGVPSDAPSAPGQPGTGAAVPPTDQGTSSGKTKGVPSGKGNGSAGTAAPERSKPARTSGPKKSSVGGAAFAEPDTAATSTPTTDPMAEVQATTAVPDPSLSAAPTPATPAAPDPSQGQGQGQGHGQGQDQGQGNGAASGTSAKG